MDCVEIEKRLAAWADDELPAGLARRIDLHLSRCPVCRLEAQGQRQIVAALHALSPMAAPKGFARKALAAFRNALERPGLVEWWQQLNSAMRGAVCSAALAGLLCGGMLASSLTTLSVDKPINPYQTLYASQGIYP